MDLAMMLSGEKRDDPPPAESPSPAKRARSEPSPTQPPPPTPQEPSAAAAISPSPKPDSVVAAASAAARGEASPTPAPTPYSDLQRAVHNALENKTAALTTSDKVALALEVLRARQLELDLAQARNNIEALVTKTGSAPRTLRAVIPASTVKGLPVGTPIEISTGKFLLSPTTNDPQALFLTLELQSFGPPRQGSKEGEKEVGSSSGMAGTTVQGSSAGQASSSVVNAKDVSCAVDASRSDEKILAKNEQDEQKPV